jgi:hypothetical protein
MPGAGFFGVWDKSKNPKKLQKNLKKKLLKKAGKKNSKEMIPKESLSL